MLIPITEYYIEEEYAYALRLMRQMLERQRIATVARLANSQGEAIKKTFKDQVKATVSQTKESLQIMEGQLDTAIKGAVRDQLEQVVKKKLPKYNKL
ncbi:TPA: hypothetical protein TUT13_000266 [Streptococcus equi subsp. zooepidemicus]|uniref:hypothetical protein n=1 Tax=Streptococcus equi TaxID=1336 RepID=UPI0005BB92C8|nr:hypothetical protein [Streptococcus equi]HEL0598268.1 hypothetical protein [Streptococcus equi subsp. zooepidemicus]KIS10451.1 hypothetical protein N594_01614 [Streptococcus equi subsp. zooepidemicus Sz16]HEL0708997.1 hypothetical protein [Streptococcus equi subsp. zooepidemicus]HEL0756317.1 hypothetical protein [Streptococcus equi subsp. zooepidemicus]HEL1155791.1 hypothetical protein [Streptococcus equi subsp. zooepidemicus]